MSTLQAGDDFDLDSDTDESTICIIDVPTRHGNICVYSFDNDFTDEKTYLVTVDDKVRHPGCDAEAVIRALGNYLIQF